MGSFPYFAVSLLVGVLIFYSKTGVILYTNFRYFCFIYLMLNTLLEQLIG